jgi:hypothetical protein
MLHQRDSAADSFYSEALRHIHIPFDETLAVPAVEPSIVDKLTSDGHFAGLDGVTGLQVAI